jgi:hypothetical protein
MNGLDYTVSIKYMIAGYAVVLVLLPAYLISLVVRWRKLKRNFQDLEDMGKKK